MSYSRGSEWHRWDLHLHTPETKRNDNYGPGTPEEKWDRFYDYINQYLANDSEKSDIVAIGITDYSSLANYQKVKKDKRLPSSLLLIPNVEMRLSTGSKRNQVNIHFLFDPAFVDEVDGQFFSDLEFHYNGEVYKATHKSLTDLGMAMGKAKGDQLDSTQAYLLGLDNFNPSLDTFINLFKNHPKLRDHTLIGVPNSSNDGASGIKDGNMQAYRDSLYQFCDFIFSGREKDREYFLGLGCDSEKEVSRRYGSRMPCLHGSDAHKLEKIFEPDDQRYCWIKAEPTFNGLRQVIYEPESRVSISPSKPEQKSGYYLIKSVQFQNSNFNDTIIPLNQNFNCIIGGRSTGKTCFLRNLANAIDSQQVERREQNITSSNTLTVNTTVNWLDGSQNKTDSEESKHKIIYIPQSYLNSLSEDTSSSDINEMIEPIILSNDDNLSAKEAMDKQIANIAHSIRSEVFKFGELVKEVRELKSQMSEIGTREGISSEINKINDRRTKIVAQNQISEEDVVSYNDAQKQLQRCEIALSAINSDKEIVETMDTLFEKIGSWPTLTVESARTELDKAWEEIQQQANGIWCQHKQTILNDLSEQKQSYDNELQTLKQTISRLKPSIDNTEELKSLSERLAKETQKLDTYTKKEEQENNDESRLRDITDHLFSLHASFKEAKKCYADKIIAGKTSNDSGNNDVSLGAEVVYQYDLLASCITTYVDGRKLRSRKELHTFIEEQKEGQVTSYPESSIKQLIHDSILDGSLIKGDIEQFISAVFADCTVIRYQASLDGDKLAMMSPGKKALVYLKLLIELESSKSPILIDQPEDDLDNRSIFEELIPFLKNKKHDRQMIIVTHNANIVLGADAEEIIVANQNGAGSSDPDKHFEYISGAIEDDKPQDPSSNSILQQKSIQTHICEVLDGGRKAFEMRRRKYTDLVD